MSHSRLRIEEGHGATLLWTLAYLGFVKVAYRLLGSLFGGSNASWFCVFVIWKCG